MVTINVSLRSKEKSDYIRSLLEDPKQCVKSEVSTTKHQKSSANQTTHDLPYIVNRIDNYKVSILPI